MKRITKVCLDCKFEEIVMVFTSQEASGNRVTNIEEKCKKCGSKKVEFKPQ